ncbi:MAG: hypothetical protein AB7E24_20810 [Novosphingobium sp.]
MAAHDDSATVASPVGAPRTIRTDTIGKHTLRLVAVGKTFAGLLITAGQQKARIDGEDPDAVWRELKALVGKSSDAYFGFEGALTRFRSFFPDGFQSAHFDKSERDYKLEAKRRLDKQAPLNEAVSGTGYGEAVLAVFRATNLPSPYEKTRLQPLLRGPDADTFVQAAARFAIGDIEQALATMSAVLARHDCAKWTVATYLPFLWRPEHHMFLKPVVTGDFAERVGHPFAHDYQPALNPAVYSSLLDLTGTTRENALTLNPRDNIDLQSFIWVVGEYREEWRQAE